MKNNEEARKQFVAKLNKLADKLEQIEELIDNSDKEGSL